MQDKVGGMVHWIKICCTKTIFLRYVRTARMSERNILDWKCKNWWGNTRICESCIRYKSHTKPAHNTNTGVLIFSGDRRWQKKLL